MRSSNAFAERLRALLCAGLLLAAPAARAAEEPLDTLLAGMASSRGVEARFVESKQVSLLAQPVESRGVLYFVPPDRMLRRTEEPVHSELRIVGEQLNFRAGDDPQVDLSKNPAARAFVDNFIALFRGDRQELETRYRVEFETKDDAWTMRLAPRPPLDAFLRAITLSGDGQTLRELVLVEADGDTTTTEFREVDHDRAFSESEIEQLFAAPAR